MFKQNIVCRASVAEEGDEDEEIIVDDIDEEDDFSLQPPFSASVDSATSIKLTTASTLSSPSHIQANQQLVNIRQHGILQILDLFNSKYDCKVCRKKLRYKADEIIHEFKHRKQTSGEQNNVLKKCPYCDETMRTYHKLTRHLMIKHLNERPYSCRVCKKRFSAFIALKKHCVKHHVYNTSQSVSSSVSSLSNNSSSSNVSLHELIDYENSNLHLETRPTLDLNNNFVNKHEAEEDDFFKSANGTSPSHGTETFTLITRFNHHQCDKCLQRFYSSSDFLIHCWNNHMAHEALQTLPCNYSICWLCFSTVSRSDGCFEFTNDYELKSHILAEHLNEEFEFKCSLCSDQVFMNVDEATDHYTSCHLDLDSEASNSSNELSLAFACFSCEQIYQTLEAVEAHFSQSFHCNAINRNKKLKCCQDSFEFNNQKAYELHLYQHNYLESLRMQVFNSVYDISSSPQQRPAMASWPIVYRKTPIFSSKVTPSLPALLAPVVNNFELTLPNLTSTPSNTQPFEKFFNFLKNAPAPPVLKPTAKSASKPVKIKPALTSPSQSTVIALVTSPSANESVSLFPCDVCGHVKFKSAVELGEHLITHASRNAKRPFTCHLCSVTFVKVDQLKRHMIVHQAGERDFVCQICFSSFSRRQDLDRHLLFHNK